MAVVDSALDAENIQIDRKRKDCIDALQTDMSEENLWNAIILFQGYRFSTMKGLPFTYMLKIGKNGQLNRELVVSRMKESKTLAWSSIRLAFNKAKEMQGEIIKRPKQIGDIRGISYIYAMFLQWGIIDGG